MQKSLAYWRETAAFWAAANAESPWTSRTWSVGHRRVYEVLHSGIMQPGERRAHPAAVVLLLDIPPWAGALSRAGRARNGGRFLVGKVSPCVPHEPQKQAEMSNRRPEERSVPSLRPG